MGRRRKGKSRKDNSQGEHSSERPPRAKNSNDRHTSQRKRGKWTASNRSYWAREEKGPERQRNQNRGERSNSNTSSNPTPCSSSRDSTQSNDVLGKCISDISVVDYAYKWIVLKQC